MKLPKASCSLTAFAATYRPVIAPCCARAAGLCPSGDYYSTAAVVHRTEYVDGMGNLCQRFCAAGSCS
jgi:hypothetical protein